MRAASQIGATFPLILTFSPWEKEQPLNEFVKFVSRGAASSRRFARMLGAFLPLRVGGVCGTDGERAGVRCAFN